MATPREIEVSLNTGASIDAGSPNAVDIIGSVAQDATYDNHYCVGNIDSYNKSMWVRTTSANTAAQQAVEIRTALLQDGNVDPNIGP